MPSVVVLTLGGLTTLSVDASATLSAKASAYQAIAEARHDRHGMMAGCNLPTFGNLSGTVQTDNDNNGLWTSLMVVAMYMKYDVTGDPQDAAAASKWFRGIQLLNNVTGKTGLMARSCCAPDEYGLTCGGHTHDKESWHASSNPEYKGWYWKGDTSSDEVAGHMFALAVVSWLSPLTQERALARQLLLNIVGGIVENDYGLIDITGNATTWGKWGPEFVNGFRGYSDERGLQSECITTFVVSSCVAHCLFH
jgi:hypothetical protein